MADDLKKPFFPRQINFATLVLGFLLLFSFAPLTAFSFFTLNGILAQLNAIEENAELHFMKDELHHLETRIEHYQQMVDFVSQLPAVMEILDHGKSRAGSIDRETAFLRYTGVLNRAFARNSDVVHIHVLDRNSVVRFSLSRIPGSTKYQQEQNPALTVDPESVKKTLAMHDKGFLLVPLHQNQQAEPHQPDHQLLIRIFSPIRAEEETIGAYIADIDMGVLTQLFPQIRWVLDDGCYLAEAKGNPTAFQDFPGLKQIFASKKTAIWNIADQKMAWIPFLPGENDTVSLWAGKRVDLASVQTARKKIMLTIAVTLALLLTVSLLLSFFFSKYVRRLSGQFLACLEEALLRQKQSMCGRNTRVLELAAFSDKLDSLLSRYGAMEEERKAAQNKLQESEDIFRVVFNSVQSAVILIDDQDTVRFFNPAAERIFGYTSEEILGQKLHRLVVVEEMQQAAHEGLAEFWQTGHGPILDKSRELVARKKDGRIFPAEVFVARVKKDDAYWAVGAVMDITDRKVKEEKLVMLATMDGLTGVFNRRHFLLLAEQEAARSKRYNKDLFFLMFDLDLFKEINDTFGHETGDRVLQDFAAICTEGLRRADIFGRMGGEEFAAIVVEANEEEAMAVAERIRKNFAEKTISRDETERHLSVSIGISRLDPEAGSLEAAYAHADKALYEAKEQGRNRVVMASR
ncbi:GGDEF domain-containing protein [Thiovibrio frasassiensis]|uniref:diguanylate cyclase n=1 Tax=Thiovibrio frasassiensis TaxID=2984131 RepID=A0A9X4MHE0_9BACT|nr:diguanylate cyclase [Thiovibrio frasassiensis]MDG4475885.1 sensor domain-containing diguanylate cyclase [Thiovibrio frasassiensis]